MTRFVLLLALRKKYHILVRLRGSANTWQFTGNKQFAGKYVTILDFITSDI